MVAITPNPRQVMAVLVHKFPLSLSSTNDTWNRRWIKYKSKNFIWMSSSYCCNQWP